MTEYDYFELRRLSDDLIYQFDRRLLANGRIGYQRRDQDLWINYRPEWGWVAYDDVTQSVTGRPWQVDPRAQDVDHPPEGEWVSKKGTKSYIYELKYVTL